jgi:hypothetical protein
MGKVPTLLLTALVLVLPGFAKKTPESRIRHVLLISIDGLHALDVANYVQANPKSALAGSSVARFCVHSSLTVHRHSRRCIRNRGRYCDSATAIQHQSGR